MDKIKKFDRICLLKTFKENNKTITDGTIGTVREFLNDDTVLIQYDYNWSNHNPVYIGVPICCVEKATKSQLDHSIFGLNPEKLLPTSYLIGQCYSIINMEELAKEVEGEKGCIVDVELAENEMNDILIFKMEDGRLEKHNRKYIDDFASYIGYVEDTGIQFAETKYELELIDEVEEDQSETSEDDIFITINNFTFTLRDEIIVMPNIEMKELNEFNNAVTKLIKLIGGSS